MTDLFGWKSGSGGEHHYATIFLKHIENYELILISMNTLG